MAKDTDDEPLKRLGGGRWETKDGRFTIEPQGGTWSLLDAEQADELGLPLVRGPFRSLTAAKEAIAGARAGDAPASPLALRAVEIQQRTAAAPTRATKPKPARPSRSSPPKGSSEAAIVAEPDAVGSPGAADPPSEVPDGVRMETIFIVEAPYAEDAAARRPAVRHEHLSHIAELLADGRLIEGGGYLDMSVAILMVRASSEEEALGLFKDDVYVRAGVWTGELRVKPFGRTVVDPGKS